MSLARHPMKGKFQYGKKKQQNVRSKLFKLERQLPHQVIQRTHHELLLEVQYKYPALFNLSRKTDHSLLEEIAKIIFHRLKDVMSAHVDTRDNCFKLSGHYRKIYPHFGDYQMIMSTLHALQDVSGAPRLQLQEKELLQPPPRPHTVENIPVATVKSASLKYSDKIVKTMVSHIKSLDTKIAKDETEDSVAKKKVREELKKMLPYLPTMVKQVVDKYFMPQNAPMHRIRIYGEPFLPSKEQMSPFVARHHGGASRVIRHPLMYNLLLFKVPRKLYAQLMAMDGTVISGAKLVIRSDTPVYEASSDLKSEMSAALGGSRDDHTVPMLYELDDDDDDMAE